MKRIMFFIIILVFSVQYINAKNYAILISAGMATTDDVFSNSEYWYDLFLAYEDLVLNQGYNPADIFVFYGNGTSFNSSHTRYQTSLHGWGNIVDFDNSYNTLNTEFANIASIITNDDNLHIRWVVGHGGGNAATTLTTTNSGRDPINDDDYWVLLENRNLRIRETELIRIINQISNYKRRKIIWMTCFSGCLASGANNLNNNKTVLITSSYWSESSYPYFMPNGRNHAEFNYVVTSSLSNEDPLGSVYNADNNNDDVVSMYELWYETRISSIMRSISQLGDNGNLAAKIFIDENLILDNVGLQYNINYLIDGIELKNSTIQSNSNIEINIDETFKATGTLSIPQGAIIKITP